MHVIAKQPTSGRQGTRASQGQASIKAWKGAIYLFACQRTMHSLARAVLTKPTCRDTQKPNGDQPPCFFVAWANMSRSSPNANRGLPTTIEQTTIFVARVLCTHLSQSLHSEASRCPEIEERRMAYSRVSRRDKRKPFLIDERKLLLKNLRISCPCAIKPM